MAHGDRKTRRLRGSRMHGWGNTQKHRGAGSRGGVGMAGSKKQRWQYVSKYMPGYFGRTGFTRHAQTTPEKTINAGWLSQNIKKLVSEGMAAEAKGTYSVDLTAAGYTKLLGTGAVEARLNVKVGSCSAKAREKIQAAGGSVEASEEEADTKESG
jgi:large subunit ribosomal protein L15